MENGTTHNEEVIQGINTHLIVWEPLFKEFLKKSEPNYVKSTTEIWLVPAAAHCVANLNT